MLTALKGATFCWHRAMQHSGSPKSTLVLRTIPSNQHRLIQDVFQLGVIPGSGGSQRLTHAIGKSRAMEIILTGRNFSAQEASDWGLVSRIVSEKHDETVAEAIKVAEKISSKGRISVQAAKEAVGAGEAT